MNPEIDPLTLSSHCIPLYGRSVWKKALNPYSATELTTQKLRSIFDFDGWQRTLSSIVKVDWPLKLFIVAEMKKKCGGVIKIFFHKKNRLFSSQYSYCTYIRLRDGFQVFFAQDFALVDSPCQMDQRGGGLGATGSRGLTSRKNEGSRG